MRLRSHRPARQRGQYRAHDLPAGGADRGRADEGGTAAGTFYYTYTDHLGNVTALSTAAGAFVTGSKARYDPFGTFTTTTPTSNPSISNHGFTGHRHNNTGTNDLDLIYMNARYYMPLVGRFISPDTIVPEPGNPQSFNRYAYVRNSPMNFTDPTGHCAGSWDGVGNSYDENLCWSAVASIGNMWDDTDYWQQQWGSYEDFFANVGSHPLIGTEFFSDELMRYFQSDQHKAWSDQRTRSQPPPPPPIDTGDYWVVGATSPLPLPFFAGVKIIRDDWGTWYVNIHEASAPGISAMRGQIYVNDSTRPIDALPLSEFPIELQADLAQTVLPGVAGGASAGAYFVGGAISVSSGPNANLFVEGGFYRPGFSSEIGYTFILPWTR